MQSIKANHNYFPVSINRSIKIPLKVTLNRILVSRWMKINENDSS